MNKKLMAGREDDERLRRGQETRQRLLESGVRLFGQRGFDNVTTRDLADAAGCNQAAILYHFGGKEQVYLAVAEHVAAHVRRHLLPMLPTTAERHGARAAERLADLLGELCRGFIALVEDGHAPFIVREQTAPGLGFDILYRGYLKEVHECVCELVASATRASASADETIVRAHSLIGLALHFAVNRQLLLRRARWRAYSSERVNLIVREVVTLARRALGAPTKRSAT